MPKSRFFAAAMAALVMPLSGAPALAQAAAPPPSPAPYINLVEMVVIPSELPRFLEIARENAAATIKDPGVREFNITQLATNPNHVFFYEVYDNEAVVIAHRATDHFKKYQAESASMIADRSARLMGAVEFHSNGH